MIAYLDHAATTPMVPQALEAMTEQLAITGNASSLHTAGRAARRVVEESREQLAAAVDARPSEVIFTSGGTESDNLAVKGTFWARVAQRPTARRVLVSEIEHHAVLDAVEWLEQHEGAEISWLPVDKLGRLRLASTFAELERDPADIALVSVMWANNEVGTVQPLAEIVRAAQQHGVPVHSDAVQAMGQVPMSFAEQRPGPGHDLRPQDRRPGRGRRAPGPARRPARAAQPRRRSGARGAQRDAGCRRRARLRGGGRPGRTPTGRGVGATDRAARRARPTGAARRAGGAAAGGPDPTGRLPGNALITFPGCEGDSLLYLLDAAGVQCSTGSACQAGVPQPSHVLLAMGVPEDDARGAIRLTLGHTSTTADVDALLDALPGAVARARHAGLTSRGAPQPAAG